MNCILASVFGRFLIDFRGQVGVENRPNIDAKRFRKSDEKKKGNKMTKNRSQVDIERGDDLFWGDGGGPGAPWERDLGGGMDFGLEADPSRTPMGTRPGEFQKTMKFIGSGFNKNKIHGGMYAPP